MKTWFARGITEVTHLETNRAGGVVAGLEVVAIAVGNGELMGCDRGHGLCSSLAAACLPSMRNRPTGVLTGRVRIDLAWCRRPFHLAWMWDGERSGRGR